MELDRLWTSPALLGATFVFHQFSLRNESKLLMPIGKKVVINGHQMNVSITGEGPETIVSLSGASPSYFRISELMIPIQNTKLLS